MSDHPAERGGFMYFDYKKIEILKNSLTKDRDLLINEKEELEKQIIRLTENTQTEQVIADMRNTSKIIDEELHSLKLIISGLNKISEEYLSGEESIVERIEDGEGIKKNPIVSFQRYPGADIYGKLLK